MLAIMCQKRCQMLTCFQNFCMVRLSSEFEKEAVNKDLGAP